MNDIPRKKAWWGLLAAGTALLSACGPGETTGSGGTTTTTTEGGGGTGGDTGGGGQTTTGAGKPDGSDCTTNDECAGGFCLTQMEFGWPNGYCTGACNSFVPCEAGSECAFLNNEPFCFKTCKEDGDCYSMGKGCTDIGDGTMVCTPKCTDDEQCKGYGICDPDSGFCVVPEDCDTPGDEDGNGLSDCEDSYCESKCMAQIDAACTGAIGINAMPGAATVTMGDTTDGTTLFAGICSGGGNKEDIYKVTIGNQGGLLELSLLSAADLVVYARNTCGKAEDLGCADLFAGGATPEVIDVSVMAGQELFVWVDGSSYGGATDNEGAYSLSTQLLLTQNEVEPNDDGPPGGTATAVSTAALPAVVTGDLDQTTDDDDWYVLDLVPPGNKTITAETIGAGGDICGPAGDVDTYMEIVDELGKVLDPVDAMDPGANEDIGGFSNWCSIAEVADVVPGKYYLHVKTSSLCTPDPMGPDCAFKYAVKINVTTP